MQPEDSLTKTLDATDAPRRHALGHRREVNAVRRKINLHLGSGRLVGSLQGSARCWATTSGWRSKARC